MKLYRKIMGFFEVEKNKKLLLYLSMFMVILVASVVMIKARVEDEIVPYATYMENKDEEQFVRNLTSGMTIEQKFTSPRDFEVMTLSCSNHEKVLPGRMLFEVYDKNGDLITSREMQNTDIVYGIPVEIPFAGQRYQMYTVKITAMDTEEEAIGFFGYLPEKNKNTAILNGEKSEYVLSIGTHNYTNLFRSLLWIVMVVMFAGLAFLLFSLWKKELPPEKVFLMLAIPMGVALLCFLSVNFINDGDAHFARAYHYANIVLGVSEKDTMEKIAMRKDDVDALYSSGFQDAQHAQNMQHIYENWQWFIADDEIVYGIEWRSAGTTNVLGYLPSVIAIIVARIFHLGTYPMLYLAKIFPFVCYLVGCYYAVKITPVGKHLMVFLAALPMSIQQATGITYDNVTYMALFMMISCYLKIYFEGMKCKDAVLLTISCILLGCCKGGIYTPILALLLFFPKQKLGGLKKKIKFILVAGILTASMTLVGYGYTIVSYLTIDTKMKVEESLESEEQQSTETIKAQEKDTIVYEQRYGIGYILESPSGFIKLIINTLIERTGYYIEGIIGRMAAWAVEKIPIWSCALFGVIILLTKNGIGEEKYKIGIKMKLGMTTAVILVVLAFFVLFLVETPYYYPYIWGIQGRYFIPLLLLILLVIRNNYVIQIKYSENMLYMVYYGQMILFVIGYFYIFMIQTYNH